MPFAFSSTYINENFTLLFCLFMVLCNVVLTVVFYVLFIFTYSDFTFCYLKLINCFLTPRLIIFINVKTCKSFIESLYNLLKLIILPQFACAIMYIFSRSIQAFFLMLYLPRVCRLLEHSHSVSVSRRQLWFLTVLGRKVYIPNLWISWSVQLLVNCRVIKWLYFMQELIARVLCTFI